MTRILNYYITIGCFLSLILLLHICFKYLFPMIGRWIVDLNKQMEEKQPGWGTRHKKWKQNVRKQIEEEHLEIER